jgi:hypothetical protein
MDALIELAKKIIAIDPNALVNEVLKDPFTQKWILDLNFQDQLFKDGIDKKGKKLKSHIAAAGGVYAASTIKYKERKGQPVDRVTLKDKGDFYESAKIDLDSDGFEIEANDEKEGTILTEKWGPILGLTRDNTALLIGYIKDEIIPIILNNILDV